jgi:hypothetical protein
MPPRCSTAAYTAAQRARSATTRSASSAAQKARCARSATARSTTQDECVFWLLSSAIPWVVLPMFNPPKNPESHQRYCAVHCTSFELVLKLVRSVITHSHHGLTFIINILQFSFRARPWAITIVTSAETMAHCIIVRTVLDHLPAVVLVFSTPTPTIHFTTFNTGMANFSKTQNWSILATFCILDMTVQNVLVLAQQTTHSFVSSMSLGYFITRSDGAAVRVLSQCMPSC